MQSKKQSMAEVLINVITGWYIGLLLQIYVFPLYGIHVNHWQNVQMSIIFTGASIVRSYLFRRGFNWLSSKGLAVTEVLPYLWKKLKLFYKQ